MGNEFIDKEQLEKLNEAAAKKAPKKKVKPKKRTANDRIS